MGLADYAVLVVDDDRHNAEIMGDLLADAGAKVLWTVSAADSVPMALQLNPDALLVDLALGSTMDGIEVIEAVRKALGRHVPAVLMTGVDPSKWPPGARSRKDLTILSKPFAAEALMVAMEAAMADVDNSEVLLWATANPPPGEPQD